MKSIYFIKYVILNSISKILLITGTPPPLDDAFFYRTCEYFTKPGDFNRAFKTYLNNRGIYEKPYFLKNGFNLKAEFKMSVIGMSDKNLRETYPLKRR